jgi:putative membrane protein insertion efficiency factor
MAIAREIDTMTVRRPLTEGSILCSAGATPAAAIGIGAVRVYQWTLRPFIGSHCRFWPSCSEYAVDALRAHGAVRGTGLAVKRILRCNPWHEGGVDPVPGIDRNTGH